MASIKDVQATGEAFSPQKRTSSPSEDKIYLLLLFFWAIFAFLDPDSGTQLDPHPDPQQC
jgi:hypothetical protein